MEKIILDELKSELNTKEKIILYVFKKYTFKIYEIAFRNSYFQK